MARNCACSGCGPEAAQTHGHEHDHDHAHTDNSQWHLWRILIAGLGLAAVLLLPDSPWTTALCLAAYLLAGYEVLWRAARNIAGSQVFDENFLMAIATLGALVLGKYDEAVGVMLFYQLGEWFQNRAVSRSRRSIAALMDLRPASARVLRDGAALSVPPEDVAVGEEIQVWPGERVPLDGVVTEGNSFLDTAALTGESLPRGVFPGNEVPAGCVNQNGALTLRVVRPYAQSAVARILELVEHAAEKKTKTEHFIRRFARWYTPAVVIAALLLAALPPLLIPGALLADWLHRALLLLVVSCPCALVLSVPLTYFGGIGGASRRGILLKGSQALEALSRAKTVVFDKTGTLTTGQFAPDGIFPAPGVSEQTLLAAAAHAESASGHPLAAAVLAAYGQDPDPARVAHARTVPGLGVEAEVDGVLVRAGSRRFMDTPEAPELPGTVIHVSRGGQYLGCLRLRDTLKDSAPRAMAALRAQGITRIAMLTGDGPEAAAQTARALGIDQVYSGLLPDGKVEKLEELLAAQSPGAALIYVGDGINDAPVLARADVGAAMGGIGSDAAIEAADVVLMHDDPARLADAIRISRKTRRIVWQNIIFSLAVKAVVLALGALGLSSMWEAVFADVGVAALAILNAARAMRE